jgi:hypothetical protein
MTKLLRKKKRSAASVLETAVSQPNLGTSTPQARVRFEKTIRLSHQYQSVEFKVGLDLPCSVGDEPATYEECRKIVDDQLERAVALSMADTQKLTELAAKVIQ